jgi:hypothetical protein
MADYDSIRHAVQAAQEKRREKDFRGLNQGYTFKADGRSGFVYFREGDQILEIHWEMSGVPKYDVLISLSDIQNWTRPAGAIIPAQKKEYILNELKKFLLAKRIRPDF